MRSLQLTNKDELHKSVYNELRSVVDENTYNKLTSNYYRRTISKDPEAFYQQLPFYQIKILYVLLITLLEHIGMNIFTATYFISAVSSILGVWVLFITYKPYLSNCYLYLIPIFGLAFEILNIARLSTPDGLVFLMVSLISCFLIVGNRVIFFILPLSVLVRPDITIFVLMVNVFLFLSEKHLRFFSAINLVICISFYIGINRCFNSYSWSILFYHSFFEWLAYPANSKIEITPLLYIKGLFYGIQRLSINSAFFTYIVVALLCINQFKNNHQITFLEYPKARRMLFLFLASSFYIAIHFILFPQIESRFFLGEYMLTAIGYMYLLSYLNHSNKLDKNRLSAL